MSAAATIDVGFIVPSLSIEALLIRRDAAIAALERIRDAAAEYHTIGQALALGVGYNEATAQHKWAEPLDGGRYDGLPAISHDAWFEHSRKAIDAALWEHLLALSGLRTFLDAQAKQEWSEAIQKLKTPELTEQNIRDTFESLHARRSEFFERGVVKLFRELSWDYKTNKPQRFGKRLILKWLTDAFGFANSRTCEALDDLIRAFYLLDGKPEPDHRQGVYSALSSGLSREPRQWSNAYLHVRTFKNGNGHVTFLREELVVKLNHILHRHHPDALPAETR